MRIVLLLALVAGAAILVAVIWQETRYLRLRRDVVQDRQPLLHGADVFHSVHYLAAKPGADVVEDVRKLRDGLEAGGQARMVYAGRVAFTALASKQVPDLEWDAIVLVQHPSRQAYDELALSEPFRAGLARFAATYRHGMRRSAWVNLGIPIALLGARVRDLVTGRPRRLPFTPAPAEARANPPSPERLARFDALRSFGGESVVVVNLLKGGTREQRAADTRYGLEMLGLFAEGGHGPMHMGRAETLEGDASFDRVAFVHYPGIDYFLAMVNSTFFTGIVGGKQPGDTLAVPTVPFLSRL